MFKITVCPEVNMATSLHLRSRIGYWKFRIEVSERSGLEMYD